MSNVLFFFLFISFKIKLGVAVACFLMYLFCIASTVSGGTRVTRTREFASQRNNVMKLSVKRVHLTKKDEVMILEVSQKLSCKPYQNTVYPHCDFLNTR